MQATWSGSNPHKRTLTATVADARGGILSSAHFRVSGEGHRELEAWARQFGQIAGWGIEGASSWGRHTAMVLTGRGHDVRDVCANRTPRSDRARQRGKSDTLDSERTAGEVLAHSVDDSRRGMILEILADSGKVQADVDV
jgi:hypothetical protein